MLEFVFRIVSLILNCHCDSNNNPAVSSSFFPNWQYNAPTFPYVYILYSYYRFAHSGSEMIIAISYDYYDSSQVLTTISADS